MFEFAAEAASGYGPNVVGSVVSGVFAGGAAWLAAYLTHRWDKNSAKAKDEELRKQGLRRAVLEEFSQACEDMQHALSHQTMDQVRAYRMLHSKFIQTTELFDFLGLSGPTVDKFREHWDAFLDEFHQINQQIGWGKIRDPWHLMRFRNLVGQLRSFALRWSFLPVEEWSTMPAPEYREERWG